jgi:hypothetical protein
LINYQTATRRAHSSKWLHVCMCHVSMFFICTHTYILQVLHTFIHWQWTYDIRCTFMCTTFIRIIHTCTYNHTFIQYRTWHAVVASLIAKNSTR